MGGALISAGNQVAFRVFVRPKDPPSPDRKSDDASSEIAKIIGPMRADKDAAQGEGKASEVFYPEFLNEDVFAVPEAGEVDEEAEGSQRKIESWHPFN